MALQRGFFSTNGQEEWTSKQVDSKIFQLAATTSLYLALKLHGASADGGMIKRKNRLSIHFFVELSRGQFTASQVLSMEVSILHALTWNVNPPTPMKFLAYFLRFLPVEYGRQWCRRNHSEYQNCPEVVDERVVHVIYELSRYLTELSVCVYTLSVRHCPSTIAFAAMLISMDMIDPDALSYAARESCLSTLKRVTSIDPNHSNIQDAIWHIKTVCPEICNYGSVPDYDDDHALHPIAIAREAGFLATPPRRKHTSSHIVKQNSPVSVRRLYV